MINIVRFVKFIVVISVGMPFALDRTWWGLIVCLLVGGLWLYPSSKLAERRSVISLIILVSIGSAGIFFNYSQIWYLTNLVFLLIAWDLDHYTRVFQEYLEDPNQKENAAELFYSHIKRLGFLAVLGWIIAYATMKLQFHLSFSAALLLIILMIFGLRQVSRYLMQNQN